jgi:DNA sulfur modification protein DndC
LITPEELREIRRIWCVDKHEMEDSLPRIYREVTGKCYEGESLDDDFVLGSQEMIELKEICGEDKLHYELTRELLSLTRQQQSSAKRAGLSAQLERSFSRHFYDDKEDAMDRANKMAEERRQLKASQDIGGQRVAEDEASYGEVKI